MRSSGRATCSLLISLVMSINLEIPTIFTLNVDKRKAVFLLQREGFAPLCAFFGLMAAESAGSDRAGVDS